MGLGEERDGDNVLRGHALTDEAESTTKSPLIFISRVRPHHEFALTHIHAFFSGSQSLLFEH